MASDKVNKKPISKKFVAIPKKDPVKVNKKPISKKFVAVPKKEPVKKEKVLNETFKVISIRRVNYNGSYKDKIKYTFNGKEDTLYNNWKPNRSLTERKRLARKIVESRVTVPYDTKEKQHISTHTVSPKSLKKERRKGFYYSGCRAHIVVQYKNNTPFWFPKKGGTSSYTISNNKSEKDMLRNLLELNQGGDFQKFTFWLNESKTNKDVFIYGGWTYKRVFSPTGSFNGDSEYIDFVQRIFKGNNGVQTINRLMNRREGDSIPKFKII